ncbi:hypothetical protein ACTWKD_11260 [Halanaerobium saccharolyticum]|uniref:hypothetical protein n=1 Tax=Halanaerobium saccharolyticum TaxID=43595 RepID=UPI003FCDC080
MKGEKKKLKELVSEAIGDRTVTEFAKEADLNRSYLSSLKNGSEPYDPKPEILKKIAKNSYKVKYVDLMIAAGYIKKSELTYSNGQTNNEISISSPSAPSFGSEKNTERNGEVKSYNYSNEAFWDEKQECVKEHYFTFPEGYVTDSSYALKMTDNKFKDWGIVRDDYILIRPINDEPENGSTILVIIRKGGDCNRTIKRYYIINKDKVRLEPDIENYGEIDKTEIEVKGLVVYLGRKYIK